MALTVFAERRKRFFDHMEPGVAIFAGSGETLRNADTHYLFRQNSDFFYLTGFDEPDATALLIKDHSGQQRFVMFVPPKDVAHEIWDGKRAGVEGAKAEFGADEAYSNAETDEKIGQYLEDYATWYYGLGTSTHLDHKVASWARRARGLQRWGKVAPAVFRDPRTILHEMRIRKSPAEIDLQRRACAITREGHKEAMRACKPGLNEQHIVAVLEYVYHRHGSPRVAYNHIVASGENACVLHYRANNKPMADGEMLCLDSGCEYEYFSGDITSSFPVNGKFTKPQKRVYDLVLNAHNAALAMCRPGVEFEKIHETARDHLIAGLIELGCIDGPLERVIAMEKEVMAKRLADHNYKAFTEEELPYKGFYPHRTGHWLGMDVHDVGWYRAGTQHRVLEPGMVFTVEPGLYFAPRLTRAPKEFRGIGIRIEDDVLITPSGCEILTAGVPRKTDEIEWLMAEPTMFPL